MRKRAYKWAAVLTAGALLASTFTACGDEDTDSTTDSTSTETEDLEVIRAAIPTSGTDLSVEFIAVADYSGILDAQLAEAGYAIEVVGFGGGGTAVIEAMESDEIDVAFMGDLPEVLAASNGVEIQAFANLNNHSNMGILVSEDSGIESVEDLEGKTLVTYFSTVLDKYVSDVLEEYGIDEDSVTRINDGANAATLIASGEADAMVSTTAGLQTYVAEGIGNILITSDDEADLACQFLAVANTSYMEEHSDAILAITEALYLTYDWILENPDEVYEAFADKSDYADADMFREVYNDDTDFDYFYPTFTEDAIANLEELSQYLVDEEMATNLVDIDSFINTDFLEQAEEELGITS